MDLRAPLTDLIVVADHVILVYFLVLSTSYLVLIVLAASESRRSLRRAQHAGFDELFASPLTLPVSIIAPAYNEEVTIVESVRAALGLRYPQFELVIVDDGSTDGMFQTLQEEFDLVQVSRVIPMDVPAATVDSVHVPADGRPIVVVRTANSGRSGAINVGINVARYPLVCIIDGDSVLEPDALLKVSKPFADDPERVVGAGGVISAVNGCTVSGGRVTEVRVARSWFVRIQAVEYVRAFLMGRSGWSRLGALQAISGAFGLYRRDVVVRAGGLDPTCIGEDFELTLKIHRMLRDERRDYRVVFVNEPVLWTEAPPTRAVLARQRRRWHRGLIDVLWRYRGMIGNPRYGRIGLLALPYTVLFELIAPLIELAGPVLIAIGLVLGVVNVPFALLFLLVAVGYGVFLSLAAIAVEDWSYPKYERWRDLGALAVAAVLENLGYRQLHAVWRVRGLWSWVCGEEYRWGVMTRAGFNTSTPERTTA